MAAPQPTASMVRAFFTPKATVHPATPIKSDPSLLVPAPSPASVESPALLSPVKLPVLSPVKLHVPPMVRHDEIKIDSGRSVSTVEGLNSSMTRICRNKDGNRTRDEWREDRMRCHWNGPETINEMQMRHSSASVAPMMPPAFDAQTTTYKQLEKLNDAYNMEATGGQRLRSRSPSPSGRGRRPPSSNH